MKNDFEMLCFSAGFFASYVANDLIQLIPLFFYVFLAISQVIVCLMLHVINYDELDLMLAG